MLARWPRVVEDVRSSFMYFECDTFHLCISLSFDIATVKADVSPFLPAVPQSSPSVKMRPFDVRPSVSAIIVQPSPNPVNRHGSHNLSKSACYPSDTTAQVFPHVVLGL